MAIITGIVARLMIAPVVQPVTVGLFEVVAVLFVVGGMLGLWLVGLLAFRWLVGLRFGLLGVKGGWGCGCCWGVLNSWLLSVLWQCSNSNGGFVHLGGYIHDSHGVIAGSWCVSCLSELSNGKGMRYQHLLFRFHSQ